MTTRIRLARARDADRVAAIYRPSVLESATSFELEPPDAAEMARRIETTLQRTPWIVCEAAHGIAGYAYATKYRERPAYQWSVEVSAYVDAASHGRGIGRALYTSLLGVLVQQGFRNAYAAIALPNPASLGLHRAMGFRSIGVFHSVGYKAGAWHDVEWLERALAPHTVAPDAPIPLPALPAPALDSALALGERLVRPPAAEQ